MSDARVFQVENIIKVRDYWAMQKRVAQRNLSSSPEEWQPLLDEATAKLELAGQVLKLHGVED